MSTSATHDIREIDTVYAVIARCFGVTRNQLTAKTSLSEDLGIDSIDLLALAIDLEAEFDVVIADVVLHRVRTIGDTIVCVVGACELRRVEREATSLPAVSDERPTQ
jgi:acyl carrier protein